MQAIETIEQAEQFIFKYNWYEGRSRNQDEEILFLKKCESIAKEQQHFRLLYRTRAYMVSYYSHINELWIALEIGVKNYDDCKQHLFTEELLLTLAFLIQLNQVLGNYSQSELYINEVKDYLYQTDDLKKKCNIHITAAIQYSRTGDIEKCIEENETALKLAHQLKDTYTLVTIYNNYAYQIMKKKPEQSELLLNEGMQIMEKEKNNSDQYSYILAHYYLNFALLYETQKKLLLAIDYAKQAIFLLEKHHAIDSALEAEIILASAFFKHKKYEKTIELLHKIEQVATTSGNNPILIKCYQLFYETYDKKSDYENAFLCMKKYVAAKEISFSQESEKTIRNLQITQEVKTFKLEKENAEKIAHIKHEFLANMSHEIRTPINSIIGICYLLQQDVLTEKQNNYIQRLEKNGENLLGIINDVLDISKIETGKMVLNEEPKNIADIIENVCAILSSNAQKKGIDLQTDFEDIKTIFAYIDSVRFSQIFTNLISNAIKFTDSGWVRIHATIIDKTEDVVNVEFQITDTGIGIPAEKLDTLFERYVQADAKIYTSFGGTGLGLSITKDLVELMSGTIRADSTEGEGATFIINLKLKTVASTAVDSEETLNLDILQGKTILIADDLEENRSILAEIFLSTQKDVQLLFAKDGKEAVSTLEHTMPDLILMDLDMPELNGFDATIQIRKTYPNPDLKIVIVTASLLTMSKEELKEIGFDSILNKPVKPTLLLKTICEQLN
ncbi:MAG: ATP-binding protein [Chitinophagales bacterium]